MKWFFDRVSYVQVFLKDKTKLIRKRWLHQVRIRRNYHYRRKEKDPFFILTTHRTGSHMLISGLNSVPQVSFASEILNSDMHYGVRDRFISKKKVLRHVARSINDCRDRICGAKLLMVHLESHRLSVKDLKGCFPTARFIILYRQSLFRQFVSLKIAQRTHEWESKEALDPAVKVSVEIPELLGFCRKVKDFYGQLFEYPWLGSCSIVLSYENLADDPQNLFNEGILPFLGLSPQPVTITTKKRSTKPLHELVVNYPEVAPWVWHPVTRQRYSFLVRPESLLATA